LWGRHSLAGAAFVAAPDILGFQTKALCPAAGMR
jgi:hypothetical protein